MLAYSSRWNKVIAEMFGNSVGTSLDYPNLHRKLLGQGPESYNEIWGRRVREARAAGIDAGHRRAQSSHPGDRRGSILHPFRG